MPSSFLYCIPYVKYSLISTSHVVRVQKRAIRPLYKKKTLYNLVSHGMTKESYKTFSI